jgi:hypothetical protein
MTPICLYPFDRKVRGRSGYRAWITSWPAQGHHSAYTKDHSGARAVRLLTSKHQLFMISALSSALTLNQKHEYEGLIELARYAY